MLLQAKRPLGLESFPSSINLHSSCTLHARVYEFNWIRNWMSVKWPLFLLIQGYHCWLWLLCRTVSVVGVQCLRRAASIGGEGEFSPRYLLLPLLAADVQTIHWFEKCVFACCHVQLTLKQPNVCQTLIGTSLFSWRQYATLKHCLLPSDEHIHSCFTGGTNTLEVSKLSDVLLPSVFVEVSS